MNNEMQFPFGNFGENEFDGAAFIPAFMIGGPNGLSPLIPNAIPMEYRNNQLCTLFRGEYTISLINRINIQNNEKILLECEENPNYKGNHSVSLLSVYQYLNNTHFLNLLIAKYFNQASWISEFTDLQIQMLQSDEDSSYSKIMIVIETSECDDRLISLINNDTYQERYTRMITEIPEIPIIAQIQKMKSLHSPVLYYDIVFGFNTNSMINFDNINFFNFYNSIVGYFIEDAIDTFYPLRYTNHELMQLDEKLIRIYPEIDYEEKLLNLRMICSPAVFDSTNGYLYKYNFFGNDHLIGVNSINSESDNTGCKDLIDFVSSISSSEISQMVPLSVNGAGTTYYYFEDYNIMRSQSILCTLAKRNISKDKISELYSNDIKVFSNIELVESNHNIIINYWKPVTDIIVDRTELNRVMKIYGFVNFSRKEIGEYKTSSEWFNIVCEEICEVLNIPKDSLKSLSERKIKILICYDSLDMFRMILFDSLMRESHDDTNSIEDDKNVKQKKKFKLFGGD